MSRSWPVTFFFLGLLFFSAQAQADIRCIGDVSCAAIDQSAKDAGLTLDSILGDLNNNIIQPLERNETRAIMESFGSIVHSPLGTDDTKISLSLGSIIGRSHINTLILMYSFKYTQLPGISVPTLVLEIRKNNIEHIVNIAGAYGKVDFGSDILDYSTFHKALKASYGVRYHIFDDGYLLSLLGGVSCGYSDLNVIADPGSKFLVTTPYGKVGWSGVEEYNSKFSTIGGNLSIIGGVKWKSVALLTDVGVIPVYLWGKNDISKNGTVGPFFGNSGFFKTSVFSSTSVSSFLLIPQFLVSTEVEFYPGYMFGASYGPPLFDSFQRGTVFFSHGF